MCFVSVLVPADDLPQNGLPCYCHAFVSHCSFGAYANFRPVSGLPSDYPHTFDRFGSKTTEQL